MQRDRDHRRAAIYAARARHSAKAARASVLLDLPRDEIALLIDWLCTWA